MKEFKMTHMFFGPPGEPFTEETAPNWLCKGGVPGSTMDNRWFWNDHVLTLEVGETVRTDFNEIRRTS